ncbi:hypothetical protein DFH06DRAFT_1047341 [Mycena polygramma]|nr:hypothetical protein DFH06DRAFT_1047341 [Mycena polygramma]
MANVQVLAPGTPIPAEGVFTAQPVVRPPNKPGGSNLREPPPPPQNLRLAPTVSTSSGSSSSSGPPATPTFFFPSSRTRAHPKAPTQFALSTGKKKEAGARPRFLGIGLNRKKAAVAAASGPADGRVEGTPSPMERTLRSLPPEDAQYAEPMNDPEVSYGEWDMSNRESMLIQPPSPNVVTKIGQYPLDAYDAGLIENDRQTLELLRKLNSTNTPSFHNYGGRPPQAVLDLGCGAGHWMLDAAMAWRNSGTQIFGMDMVDITKGLWPIAHRHGIADNLKFVRGNFVKQALPFPDASFQLVRMANLALCMPQEKWEFVLDQVWRVLAVGGRLEFIDDHVFFPYGKPPLLNPRPQSPNAPNLDITIPSTVFSRMSLADVVNPSVRDDTDSQIYDLYGVEEEDEEHSDADTVASGRRLETPTPHTRSSSRSSRSGSSSLYGTPPDPEVWHEQAAAARELEGLFEHMMNVKFGIHLRPSEFVLEMLMRVFGGVKEMTAMHLTLAPPEQAEGPGANGNGNGNGNGRPLSVNGRPRSGRFERQGNAIAIAGTPDSDALSHCPGLILWPSTFIPMQLPELETHASKHLRVLLSCKSALVDYAAEIADQGEGGTQGEAAMEALWEYQNFLRERFNPPPDDPSRALSDASSDANSIHNSVFSVSSVGMEALDAMREYQSELHDRFEWTSEPRSVVRDTPTPTPTPPPAPRVSVTESALSASSTSASTPPRPRKSRSRGSRGRDRAASNASSLVPPYSRIELTHVRTFYVYEAVKQAEGRFGHM